MVFVLKDKIDITSYLSSLDWIVFTLIFLVTLLSIAYGHYLKRKEVNSNNEQENLFDLLLLGRRLTLPLFIATLVATWYGGIFGVTQIAFEKGIFNFITQGVFWYITYIIFAVFMVKKVRQSSAVTLPDMIGKMFGPKAAYVSAIFNLLNVIPIVYTISLGLFLKLIFGGELLAMMALGTTIVLLYSILGGLRAVIYSDLIQFFVMITGVLLVFIFSITTFGGLEFLQLNLPASHFSITGGEPISVLLAWGLIALATLIDPNFYQRCFAATNYKVARKGIFISTVIWVFFDICTTAGAMYAKATIPHAESNLAYLTYALQILPDGLRGFFMAGILATIISTLDSYLFIAGTTISYDLLPKKLRTKLSSHYLGIISVGIFSIILAYYFNGNIKVVWKTIGSYFSACLLIPVLFGHFFPKRISDNNFIFVVPLGIIATTYWRLVPHNGFWKNIDEIYIGSLATLIPLTLILIFSYTKRTFR